MNKRITLLFALFLSFAIHVKGQFTVDAGKDTVVCMCSDTLRLGGTPTAQGGTELYTYTWKLAPVFYKDYQLLASDLLNDSTASNPILNCYPFINDTVTFFVTVTDADSNTKSDSVKIAVSSIELKYAIGFVSTINQGDSVQLEPLNVFNGIAPFSYQWTPATGLSNPFDKNPYAKPDESTQYTCIVTDALGCTTQDQNDVVVNPVPFPAPTNLDATISYIMMDEWTVCNGEVINGPGYCTSMHWNTPDTSQSEAHLKEYNIYYLDMFEPTPNIFATTKDTVFTFSSGIMGQMWVTAVYENPTGESEPSNIYENNDLPINVLNTSEASDPLKYNRKSQVISIDREQIMKLFIYNSIGQVVMAVDNPDEFISTSHLQPDIYFVVGITKTYQRTVLRVVK